MGDRPKARAIMSHRMGMADLDPQNVMLSWELRDLCNRYGVEKVVQTLASVAVGQAEAYKEARGNVTEMEAWQANATTLDRAGKLIVEVPVFCAACVT